MFDASRTDCNRSKRRACHTPVTAAVSAILVGIMPIQIGQCFPDECHKPQGDTSSLLQMPVAASTNTRKTKSAPLSASVEEFEFSPTLHDTKDMSFVPERRGNDWGLRLPSNWSRFTFGALPSVLPSIQRAFNRTPWINPSIVELPRHLQSAFPDGRFLVSFTVLNNKPGERLWPPVRTQIQIVDERFRLLAHARIGIHNGKHGVNETEVERRIIGDGRMLRLHDGRILIGFTPYSMLQLPHKHRYDRDWQCFEFVASLHTHVSASGTLSAWIDRQEMRMFDLKIPSASIDKINVFQTNCLKNLGFFEQHSGTIDVLLSVYPTISASFQLSELDPSRVDQSEYVTRVPLTSPRQAAWLPLVPWAGAFRFVAHPPTITSQEARTFAHIEQVVPVQIHNGPHPIWIEELQQYLGVGHFFRGIGDRKGGRFERLHNHHYTHIFFTLSKGPTYTLNRVSNREFCFGTGSVCDSVQLVSSIVRVGDVLHIGYGRQDQHSSVATVNASAIFNSLRSVGAA